ncbi:MAG: 4-hydroxy-3-methylbut-2-enyl diphosphate reductase [Elusimicrobiales bacterium]|nr:4-hydroxy-3-methylbut-2-enyl diphosphate reductase [Elusimicrobiales bacterium]
MRIIIAQNAGFCPGVNNAIEKVIELASKKKKKIYTLGQLIHNNEVIKELEKRKIKAIEKIEEIEDTENSILVIRAHGIPPELEKEIKDKKIDFVDATCPLVKRVHRIITYYKEKGYKTIILGDPNHAEVIGLIGYAKPNFAVISSEKEAEKLTNLDKVNLVSQTTQEEELFIKVAEILSKKSNELIISNTICEPTKNRQKETKHFALNSDLVIVVGAKHSANTKRLYEICKNLNKKAILIENDSEITPEIFNNVETVFITAGASTPKWLIEKVARKIKKLTTQKSKIYQLTEFMVLNGFISLFSFITIIIISSKIMEIKLKISEILSLTTALNFAHLINRFSNTKEENIRKFLIFEYQKTTKSIITFFLSISILLSLTNKKLIYLLIPFIILSITYKKFEKINIFRITKETLISLGWLYIFVIIPFLLAKKTELTLNIIISSFFILTLSFIRNTILRLLYIHSDMISDKIENKKEFYIIITISTISLFSLVYFLEIKLLIFLIILFVYYLFIHQIIHSKKLSHNIINELLVELPFIILLGYFIAISFFKTFNFK